MKRFCFRFDVDTENCIRNGVPKLLGLAEELDVSFSFFINMGRAAKRRAFLSKIARRAFLSKIAKKSAPPKLSSMKKIGKLGFAKIALLNPMAGCANRRIVQEINDSGHEVGLHGGKNHGDWMCNALKWDRQRVEAEIDWGMRAIEETIGRKPAGFAAPGFVSSRTIREVLASKGFEYCSDSFGENRKILRVGNFKEIPVNIVGEGGVGFIEAMEALGKNRMETVKEAEKRLLGKDFAVTYDHPGYTIKNIETVRGIILAAKNKGFKICTMEEIARKAVL